MNSHPLRNIALAVLLGLGLLLPTSVAFAEEPFDYFQNNWNVLGLKDYERGARVTPDNQLLLAGKSMVRIEFGRDLTPLSRSHAKLAMEGWLPVMMVSAHDGPVRYDCTMWATPLPSVKDWQAAYDWPTEGENFLNWIHVQATNTSDEPVEAKVRLHQSNAPTPPRAPQSPKEVASDDVQERNEAFAWQLAPGASEECVGRFAFSPLDDPRAFDDEDHRTWLERTVAYWHGVAARTTKVEVPCDKATQAFLASHVCQLIANDHGELHGGEGFYDTFYIRDGAYQIMEVEEAGLHDVAAKAIEFYLQRQRPDGRFESQSNQFDANGQAQWTLWQYYKITGDQTFLARAYPQMLRATRWAIQARKTAPADSPFAGLLPPAPADGECLWDGKHHIPGYDLWNLRGMICTADAASILGHDDTAKEILADAADYRRAIDVATKKTGLGYFPPSWEKDGTHWGNTETLWPTELFDRDDPRVVELSRHVREDFAGGFVEGIIQWTGRDGVIHPYMGAYTTMNDLVRGRHEQVVEDFYWYLLHTTAANAFPEGIYHGPRIAWSNTIPHVTGASNYAVMLRHILIHEAGDTLSLLPAVPDWWLDEGQEIRVERAPTHFGVMSLVVRGTREGVEVELDPPRRNPPARIQLHLPKSRPLTGSVANVEVITRTDQTTRWDFPTVVEKYKALRLATCNAPSLTTNKPSTCSHALPPYPAHLANDGRSDSTAAYWATDVTKHPNAWWQVDLEQPTTVGRVVVIAFHGDERHYGFTVETSLDAKTWQMVADHRDNTAPSTAKGHPCTFEPRMVRYIRVTQTSNSANTGRHLVEVMAFEK